MIKRSITIVAIGLAVGAALFVAGDARCERNPTRNVDPCAGRRTRAAGSAQLRIPAGGSLDDLIASLQSRWRRVPDDHDSWATLGLAYVQQAKVTVDSDATTRGPTARWRRSLEIDDTDNFLAYAGLSALASARHDFAAARDFAEHGLEINAYSAILYGALSDAELQLGNYDAAFAAVQRMVDLSPDMASLSRASYTWELRGNVDEARRLMQRALADAPTAADRAFALVHLGGLAFDEGDANAALRPLPRGARRVAVGRVGAGRARQGPRPRSARPRPPSTTTRPSSPVRPSPATSSSTRDCWSRSAEPTRPTSSTRCSTPRSSCSLPTESKPTPPRRCSTSTAATSTAALADAERGIASRPFIVMHDAYAWALHAAGRDAEALAAIDRAMALGHAQRAVPLPRRNDHAVARRHRPRQDGADHRARRSTRRSIRSRGRGHAGRWHRSEAAP